MLKSVDRAGLTPLCLARPVCKGGPGLAMGSSHLASRHSLREERLTLPKLFVPTSCASSPQESCLARVTTAPCWRSEACPVRGLWEAGP